MIETKESEAEAGIRDGSSIRREHLSDEDACRSARGGASTRRRLGPDDED
jgi:hypothetical protein